MNRRGVRLGRVLGVEIFLHPSWFLLAGLIAFVLGQGFSTGSPSFSGAGAVVLGLMGAVLFFASLLAHELAHSVVAERKGIPVHRITLFLLGGAAQIVDHHLGAFGSGEQRDLATDPPPRARDDDDFAFNALVGHVTLLTLVAVPLPLTGRG